MPNHPAAPLLIDDAERDALAALVRARTTEQRTAMRAKVVLAAADGMANERIAAELGVHKMTVLLWRGRFAHERLAGLADAPRPGRVPTYGRADRDRVIALTLEPPTDGTTHWSARRMAVRSGISITTVQRIWAEAGLKPHRTETFKFSRDPDLEAKIRDVVGLYLAPRERAVVLSLDEKTQIQALDRTQPMLPLRPGQVERHTHDYARHGTTHLFAALEVGTGRVTTQARARHTGDDFLAFLRQVERAYPKGALHVVLDNVSTHKTPAVQAWLAERPRITFHFTPTSASWMNQIETWFGILSRQAIRRGSFGSIKELVARIDAFTASWNAGASPFVWVKSADQILAKPYASGQRSANRDTSESGSGADSAGARSARQRGPELSDGRLNPASVRKSALDEIEVEGLNIAYRRAGDGPPLVLLHGGPLDSREWRRQLEELSDEFTLVAWDMPGCGQSQDPPAWFRTRDYANCLAAFIEAVGLERPHVLGLSFGSGLALELYRWHPAIPRTLLLASAYAGWAGSLPAEVAEQRKQQMLRRIDLPPDQWAREWIPTLLTESAPTEVVDEVVAILSDFHPAGQRALLDAGFAEHDLRDVLPRIAVPTLLLYGDQDLRSPLNVAEEMHAKITGSRLVVMPGVGHMSDVEAPERFNAEVRGFLRSVGNGTSSTRATTKGWRAMLPD